MRAHDPIAASAPRRLNPYGRIAGARPREFPAFIEPAHPTQHDRPPKGDQWVHEIKVDGYRCQLHLNDGAVQMFTRRGYDWSERFKSIARRPNTCR